MMHITTPQDLRRHYSAIRQRLNAGYRPAPAPQPKPAPVIVGPIPTPDPALLYIYAIGPSRPTNGKAVDRDVMDIPTSELATRRPLVGDLMLRFARSRGVSLDVLRGSKKKLEWVRARQELMWILRVQTKRSYPDIARLMGRQDHTTIIHGVKQHEARLKAGVK